MELITLMDKFGSDEKCRTYLENLRFPDGVKCLRCESDKISRIYERNQFHCDNCKYQFSVTVDTIFHNSHLPLQKWFAAIYLMCESRKGISANQLKRTLNVAYKTAWYLCHRIRKAVEEGNDTLLTGIVEVDETFIGGLAKNMHKHKREAKIQGRGSVGKTAVMGLLERKGRVLAKVIERTDRETLHNEVKSNVETGANLFTDEWRLYRGLDEQYVHEVINHGVEYVRGHIHTNGIENFWSLLKRTINGTYVSVEPFHLGRYLDEQMFRFNEQKVKDQDRFLGVLKAVSGKRLTYDELRDYGS